MKLLTTTSLMVFTAAMWVATSINCPHPWRAYKDNCYLFYSGGKTFANSELYCQSTGIANCRDAHLVSIADLAEFIFVRDLVYSVALEPVAFYMGGYTSDECKSGAWTDESGYQICTGDVHEDQDKCEKLCQFESKPPCTIEKCLVSSVESWLFSIGEGNFSAVVGEYGCNETKLPFVCKTSDLNVQQQ